MRDVKAKEVSWLWKPYIVFGKVTLIQGDTGIGKTSLMMKVIADLSNGVYPPTMFRECLQPQETGKPLTTYYISIENGINDTIVPLFDLLGGNRDYVQYQEERNGHFVLTEDEIRECVKMTGARLIVVDSWQQFLDNASSTDNNALRNMIREVVETARSQVGKSFQIYEGMNRIGRAGNLEVSLSVEDTVSRNGHAEIVYENGCFEIYPLKEERNVYVNGMLIDGPVVLKDRDVVGIGECVFSFVMFDDVY